VFNFLIPIMLAWVTQSYGSTLYSHQTLSDLTLYGQMQFESCVLTGKIRLFGNVLCKKCAIDHATIYGNLDAKECDIHDTLTLYSNHATLSNCHTHDILIHSNEPATLYLDHSEVKGSVTFVDHSGVIMRTNSIIHGYVHGATT